MQDEDEEAYRQRYLQFLREVEDIVARHSEVIREAQKSGSAAAKLNALSQQCFALTDAIDRLCNAGAREALEKAVRQHANASSVSIESHQSKLNRRQLIKKKRLEFIVAVYQQRLIAADFLRDSTLPSVPGMESAYAIAGNVGGDFPHLSRGAVEQFRYRMAREAETAERGRYVRFDSDTLTYSDTGGPILDLLDQLPKKRGRPKC